ncbi:MAG: hypothetical protein M3458_05125 [Acidobacteriota bacterium]|nr:hypothetical protein [Acidobacteriota bacterium]
MKIGDEVTVNSVTPPVRIPLFVIADSAPNVIALFSSVRWSLMFTLPDHVPSRRALSRASFGVVIRL